MTPINPLDHAWWLASRASGIVALAAMAFSVVLGLSLGGKLVHKVPADREGRKLTTPLIVTRSHEYASIAAMIAIAVHGLTLLGDAWLHPTLSQIAIPFTMAYKPVYTGIGIIGGYAATILGLTYYARKRIGNDRWRKMHRFVIVAFALSVVHTLGAGTDANSGWLFWPVVGVSGLIAVLTVMRIAFARTANKSAARFDKPRKRQHPASIPDVGKSVA